MTGELTNAVCLRFSRLTRVGKAEVLARIAHEQTVYARDAYAGEPVDVNILIASNELVHRLCGFISYVLTGDADANQDASIFRMVEGAVGYDPERHARWLDDVEGRQTPIP